MTVMQFGPISSDDLSMFLAIPDRLFTELDEARALLLEKRDKVFAPDAPKAVWCHFYEFPPKEHFAHVLVAFSGVDILREIAGSPNQIQAMFSEVAKFTLEIEGDEEELSEADLNDVRKSLQSVFGMSLSVVNSFRSLLVFGYYLNDLIAIVREGGEHADEAMLRAIKIDSTVLGCQSVVVRLSRAVMEDDRAFLRKVKNAMGGQLTKREQRNYQAMRLVLEMLHETNARQLNQDDLYQLFVDELRIVSGERGGDEGNVANSLRQFAFQFMRQKLLAKKAVFG